MSDDSRQPMPDLICAHCGQELNADGTKHYNEILYCAFVTANIDWSDWHTARKAQP